MPKTRTPNPWKVAQDQSGISIHYADGDVEPRIATIDMDNTEMPQALADAEFIVLACNTHDKMLAALEDLIQAIEFTPLGVRQIKSLEHAKAVIAKAKGK
jgi:hypothetical protein